VILPPTLRIPDLGPAVKTIAGLIFPASRCIKMEKKFSSALD
jgi:hypothetical protein